MTFLHRSSLCRWSGKLGGRIVSVTGFVLIAALPLFLFSVLLLFSAQHHLQSDAHALSAPVNSDGTTFIHLKARIRTPQHGDLTAVHPCYDPVPIELWSRSTAGGVKLWKAQTATRIVTANQQSNTPTTSCSSIKYNSVFSGWLSPPAAATELIEVERCLTRAHDGQIESVQIVDLSGDPKVRLTVGPRVRGSALVDKSRNIASMLDPRLYREYTLDAEGKRIESIRVYAVTETAEILLFETEIIFYASTDEDRQNILRELQST